MKIFQLKFNTMKMIQPLRKTLLLILLVSFAFTSCNNKKDTPGDNKKEKVADDKKDNVEDADHTFNITLVKGSETIEYTGAVPNNEGGAIYNDQKSLTDEQGDRNRTIMMFIGKKYNRGAAGVFGIFRVDESWKPFTNIKYGEKNASNLSIRPKEKGDEFIAISGNLTFTNLKYVLPTPLVGAACFTIDFEGDFQKNANKGDIFQGSGTIVLSPKRDMGVYKKK